jgi:hypothetical protein
LEMLWSVIKTTPESSTLQPKKMLQHMKHLKPFFYINF